MNNGEKKGAPTITYENEQRRKKNNSNYLLK
jgi:hypothetical protein